MSTLDSIVKDYDKNIVLRDCQRHAFEYLRDKKGDLLVEDTTDEDLVAECDVDVERVKKGDFSIVMCHPEALFNTKTGHELLSDEQFSSRVVAVVIDECHIIEKW
ncbi:uncharacterized protein LOC130047326 [Ostrea edulis]|uniref:uncharacterized protein LOC130047326 n=1 Tax=Ostrea edulis TaxID=37623 RepID=UPI0024AEFA0C|nr:uncharacterized protein LOC130047326 [Ostrea edulis]